jgi:membrane protein
MKLEIQDSTILKILDFLRIKSVKFRKVVAFIEILGLRLEKDHTYLVASGISFNIILYLIPLFLVAIYLVSSIFNSVTITNTLIDLSVRFLPPNENSAKLIKSIIQEVNFILEHSSIAGWIGVFGLLWLSSALFSSLRGGLNGVFNIPSPQFFIVYRLKDIMLTIILAVLVLVFSYVLPLFSFISSFIIDPLPDSLEWIFSGITLSLITLCCSFTLFFFLFRFVPNKKQPKFVVFLSTFLCVALVEISRYIFGWYISTLASYGRFYGTYAILTSVAVWIYYFSMIFLVSAEFSQLLYDLKHKKENENI